MKTELRPSSAIEWKLALELGKNEKADSAAYDQDTYYQIQHPILAISDKAFRKKRKSGIAKGADGMKNRQI